MAYLGYRNGKVALWDLRNASRPVVTDFIQTPQRQLVPHAVTSLLPVRDKLVVGTSDVLRVYGTDIPERALQSPPDTVPLPAPAPAPLQRKQTSRGGAVGFDVLLQSQAVHQMVTDADGRFVLATTRSQPSLPGFIEQVGPRCIGYDLTEIVGLEYPGMPAPAPAPTRAYGGTIIIPGPGPEPGPENGPGPGPAVGVGALQTPPSVDGVLPMSPTGLDASTDMGGWSEVTELMDHGMGSGMDGVLGTGQSVLDSATGVVGGGFHL